ncbi:hybrid sensor histidine kinase/response regulator [Arcobacter arenosus]|jgi:signal transduction histidine kinase|uniref:histidine kinase n=1 Tax=Arcobacter arenosus TaxID=2576037 RepID=A0A5R8XX94_9BACT|nr:hybrid sensor histidine kinase/response regulator [Arcobacter arenosus]TLP35192.1 HAMP domain-containing protein [Arcobacter arenosus]
MSFKYRFIISFVLLEIFFITLIVSINFIAIVDSSNKLINDNINSKTIFLEDLVKVPLSIYDLATLDNIIEKAQDDTIVNSIILLNTQEKIISSSYKFEDMNLEELIKIKEDKTLNFKDKVYKVKHINIKEEDTSLGSMYLVFDLSENNQFIQSNKEKTLIIIFIEILISTILSYLIGSKLTNKLTRLSNIAIDIGKNKYPKIPYTNTNDEIGSLSKSFVYMQENLLNRTKKLKDLTNKLESQKRELELANKEKDDFLANMSHELKTPLNSINVISSVMSKNKNGNLSEKDIHNITIVNKAGKDLLELINDVLDISKLEAGEIIVNNTDIDVNSFFTEIYDGFKMQAKLKSINFELICDENIGFIHSDKLRLKQIIKNLLSNSFKFTQQGFIKVNVKKNDKFLDVRVEDTGIGIEKEKLGKIFDRFKQADGSTTRKFGGTGLGLAISKQLVKLLGGNISVESSKNVGSTFKFSILINEDKLNHTLIEKTKNKNIEKNRKILVLNYDPLNLMNLIIKLKNDYIVDSVSTSKELFTNISKYDFDYIIVDFTNLGAVDIIKLKEHEKKIIAIIDKDSTSKNIISTNFNSYFEKPFKEEEIRKLIS